MITLRFDAPGGVETNVRAVAAGLRRLGADVTVYASDLFDEGRWERRTNWPDTVDGVPVKRFPVAKRLVPNLTMPLMTGLVRALSEDAPDLIHAHSHRYGHVLESAAVAERRRIPFVVSTHYHPADLNEPWNKALLLRGQDHFFGMWAYRVASALVVETEIERRALAEFAPRDGVEIIPPGIHLAEWADPAGDRAPADLPERFILFAGRIAPNKGLPSLFDALSLIPPAERPTLVLVGSDWGLRASLERRAERLGISGAVRWMGHLHDVGEYRAIFRQAQLFVLPSEYEAFGIVLLEAMIAGIPIVATAVGGVPEVLENGRLGRLVPFGRPVELATAIRETLADSGTRERYVAAGRTKVVGFDWGRAVDGHFELYRRILSGAAPTGGVRSSSRSSAAR